MLCTILPLFLLFFLSRLFPPWISFHTFSRQSSNTSPPANLTYNAAVSALSRRADWKNFDFKRAKKIFYHSTATIFISEHVFRIKRNILVLCKNPFFSFSSSFFTFLRMRERASTNALMTRTIRRAKTVVSARSAICVFSGSQNCSPDFDLFARSVELTYALSRKTAKRKKWEIC